MALLKARMDQDEGTGPEVRVELPGGEVRFLRAIRGETILDLCVREGLLLDAPCGGGGTCGRCRVTATGHLSPPDETERRFGMGNGGLRLACRCRILGDGAVALGDPRLEGACKLGEGAGPKGGTLREDLRRVQIPVPWEALTGAEDVQSALLKLLEGFGVRSLEPQALAGACSALVPGGMGELHGLARGERLVLAGGSLLPEPWGLALDLGTSTLAGSVVDLTSGVRLTGGTLRSPLASWGADLPARVGASADPESFRLMVEALREGVLSAARGWCRVAGGGLENLREVVAGGNAVMTAFFRGLVPSGLARTPFVPPSREGAELDPSSLGLPLTEGVARVLPGMGGFVGGDTAGLLLALDALPSRGVRVALDLGTNGEVLLLARGRIFVASTAAGPAFEGGRLSCGCPAVVGAVRGVRFAPGRVELDTLGEGDPAGLCGSGLLALAARLLESGVVDPSGRFQDPGEVSNPILRERLEFLPPRVDGGRPLRAFRFSDAPPLRLLQEDLRELQLAKGALQAALEVLLLRAGVQEEAVEECVLAGAFGAGVAVEDAARVGLIPPSWRDRTVSLGAGALLGMEQVLREGDRAWDRVRQRAREAEHVALEGDRAFQERFLAALSFPKVPV